MHVEIKGTNFVNKGAELMLHAVLQKVRVAFPEASLVVAPNAEDYAARAQLQLWQKCWHQRFRVQWGNLARMIPSELRRRFGLILDREIDVVLDASGFAFTDQFGAKPALVMAAWANTWKRRGTKVILLPQAMGPFTSREIRKAFASVVSNADLVFPRDDASYKHVTELVGERENIIQSPDFTNLVTGTPPHNAEQFEDRFCLVPNARMIDKTSAEEGALYRSFCARCIKCLNELGQKTFILVHEGKGDMQLAEQIVCEEGSDIPIIEETDPLVAKAILGLCSGVISSRFHALVSALSQGTPALATSWSHKYEMLLSEYGIADGCLPVTIDDAALKARIVGIVETERRNEIIAVQNVLSAKYKEQSEQMWRKVFEVMETKRLGRARE